MESVDKYKQYIIKNLANKESKYMPSLSSISDLSIDGKNHKWSKRWNSGVQGGAKIPDSDEESDNTSDSNSVTRKGDDSEGVKDKSGSLSGENFNSEEIRQYKNWLKDYYKDIYNKKFEEYKDSIENKEPSNISGYTDELNKWALTGLSFWPVYQKIFDDLNKKDKEKDQDSKERDSNLKFCCCKNIQKRETCSCCGSKITRTHTQQTPEDYFNLLVTRSVSGKPVDSLDIKFDPKLLKEKAINDIHISVKPVSPKEMNKLNSSKGSFEEHYLIDPVEIEPIFGPKHSDSGSFDSFNPNNNTKAADNINNHRNSNIQKGISQKIPEFNLYDDQGSSGIVTRKIEHSHDFPDWPSSVNGQHNTTPNYGVSESVIDGSFGTSKMDSHSVTQSIQNGSVNHNNPTKTQNKKDLYFGFDIVGMNNQKPCEKFYAGSSKDSTNGTGQNFKHGTNYNGSHIGIESQEVIDLINSGVKLHGFKINNKGVNVPLFLNVGNSSSIYSGQGFVSNTNIGLFRISVVEPIDPKVSLVNKIVNLIGMNNYKGPICKCANLNEAIEVKKNVPSKQDILNNIFNTFADYTGLPLINFQRSNSNTSDKIGHTNIHTGNTQQSNVKICDYHKNLFSHRVDRTKFGKDTFCQLKFMNSISSSSPVAVTRDSFTRGSYVSTFFNGFYEQLMCIGNTVNMSKEEMNNNHKFTFIIRQVKGSKYGKNFTIINTTTGQHLCIDLLTHELKFEEECKFSKYLVPAIFKIIPLPTILESISNDTFNCFNYPSALDSGLYIPYSNVIQNEVQRIIRSPTHMSTTDQYVNIG